MSLYKATCQNDFIETKNVARFRRSMESLDDQPGFLVVQGESGRGKSRAAINYHSLFGSVFLRVWQDFSQTAFLKSLAFEATGIRHHTAYNCKRGIIDHLDIKPMPIIVDEADRLKIERIEDLRDIHEASGVAVVLIGEEGFMPKLKARQRIFSRVADVIDFEPVSDEDIMLYGTAAADLKIAPDAAKAMSNAVGGSFRVVRNIVLKLADAVAANRNHLVTLDDLFKLGILKRKGQHK